MYGLFCILSTTASLHQKPTSDAVWSSTVSPQTKPRKFLSQKLLSGTLVKEWKADTLIIENEGNHPNLIIQNYSWHVDIFIYIYIYVFIFIYPRSYLSNRCGNTYFSKIQGHSIHIISYCLKFSFKFILIYLKGRATESESSSICWVILPNACDNLGLAKPKPDIRNSIQASCSWQSDRVLSIWAIICSSKWCYYCIVPFLLVPF